MSSELTVLIATSTAVCVIVLALVLSKLVRSMVDDASDLVPDFSRLPGRFSRRVRGRWRTPRPVGRKRVRPLRVEPGRSVGDERAGLARDRLAAPVGKELLPSPGKRTARASEAPADAAHEEAPPEFPPTLVPDVDTGRSIDVKFRQSKVERSEPRVGEEAEQGAGREASAEGGSAAYRQVGDEVTAVLTAAEHAAAHIREIALREAERTRLEANEKAAASLAEVQARRAEVDSYGEETRAAADAYAEETRGNADEKAARRVSQAEEQARRIQAEAEERGRELEDEASRRRDALTKSAEGMEARIESMLTVFRGVITELDQLLPAERRSGADKPEPPAAKRLDEALKPASSHGRLNPNADS
jgi:hypothetical protein